jgi:RNA polymerase sigma factor (sigma-70 family)
MNEVTKLPDNNLKFADVYFEFYPLISSYLHKRLKNEVAIEQIITDSLFKVNQHLSAYNCERAKLNTWIFTIVNNKLKDYFRSNGDNIVIHKSDLVSNSADENTLFEYVSDSSATAVFENRELRRKIRRAIRTLKPTEKYAAILRFVKEYDYQEIADVLDIPLNTVKVTILRAREHLQNELKYEYANL